MRVASKHKIGDRIALSICAFPRGASAPAIEPAKPSHTGSLRGIKTFGLIVALATAIGIGAVWNGNKAYAPEMYADGGMAAPVKAFSKGLNYSVFDLNLNIRKLRDEQIASFTETPDMVLLGASHWQEANASLVTHLKWYNSHIHRDYWEDLLGMIEMYVRHDRLPKKMIIAIRDKQFTPLELRKDFLWEPGIPYYRAMADRLGLEKQPYTGTLPYERVKQLFSVSMLLENLTRWHKASELPAATPQTSFKSLDVLLPDGSIAWSDEHMQVFTKERTTKESLKFAKANATNPPVIDPKGVVAFEHLLTFLQEQGVEVTLAHPPFNPQYYDAMIGTPYMTGLKAIEDQTKAWAKKFGLNIVGSFNPHDLGCTADMYIDAEHAHPSCLKAVFDQFTAKDTFKTKAKGK